MALTVTVAQIQTVFRNNPHFSGLTQADVDFFAEDCAEHIDEAAWGAGRAQKAFVYAVAHCLEMNDRAERNAAQVGASTSKTVEAAITWGYSVPPVGAGDGPWMGTVYGQRFLALRNSNPRLRLPRVI